MSKSEQFLRLLIVKRRWLAVCVRKANKIIYLSFMMGFVEVEIVGSI